MGRDTEKATAELVQPWVSARWGIQKVLEWLNVSHMWIEQERTDPKVHKAFSPSQNLAYKQRLRKTKKASHKKGTTGGQGRSLGRLFSVTYLKINKQQASLGVSLTLDYE